MIKVLLYIYSTSAVLMFIIGSMAFPDSSKKDGFITSLIPILNTYFAMLYLFSIFMSMVDFVINIFKKFD